VSTEPTDPTVEHLPATPAMRRVQRRGWLEHTVTLPIGVALMAMGALLALLDPSFVPSLLVGLLVLTLGALLVFLSGRAARDRWRDRGRTFLVRTTAPPASPTRSATGNMAGTSPTSSCTCKATRSAPLRT
jgi:hypothetical protein